MLASLDGLLQQVIAAAPHAVLEGADSELLRGLYVTPRDVERLMACGAGQVLSTAREALLELACGHPPLAELGRRCGLDRFDLGLALLALAPDVDLRYERIFAYLQDDVTRRRPSVDLALNLLCRTPAEKLARRRHVSAVGPLLRSGVLHLVADSHQTRPPLLAHYLELDEQAVRMLLGQRELDRETAALCRVTAPEAAATPGEPVPLPLTAREGAPLRVYLEAASPSSRRRAALGAARSAGLELVEASLAKLLARDGPEAAVARVLREAELQGALPFLDDVPPDLPPAAVAVLASHRGTLLLGGSAPWVPAGRADFAVVALPIPLPTTDERRDHWAAQLRAHGVALGDDAVEALAGRFRLAPEQIAEAVLTAHDRARLRGEEAGAAAPSLDELFAAARSGAGQRLASVARRIEPACSWEDIVLPDAVLAQLHDLCGWVKQRHEVLERWGFERKLSLGKGVNALFTGPSGVGKTMAAEVIARDLRLDLYKVDLSTVVSKYIGDTEKNLDRIFSAAEDTDGILFFDEAEALFGKRSEVRDSHDRYANIEVAYLLQRMEQYQGIAILATNLRTNMDDAFVRRLQFIVEFPFPGEADRARIWRVHFPADAPRDEDVDFAALARLRIAGGNIRNIVLSAAFLAAAEGRRIGMAHLTAAARREYQKLGRPVGEVELGEPQRRPAPRGAPAPGPRVGAA